jgi:hypothetical protein
MSKASKAKVIVVPHELSTPIRPLFVPVGYSWEGRSKYMPHQGKKERARRAH